MAKTLQEVLDTDLSPDKLQSISTMDLQKFLIDNQIINSAADFRMLVIEGVQKALREDDEFPIRYYEPNQEMSEEGKYVNPGECLTDDFIENRMSE